jgi:hypothetical protein
VVVVTADPPLRRAGAAVAGLVAAKAGRGAGADPGGGRAGGGRGGAALAVAGLLAVTANGVAHLTALHGPPGEPFEDLSPKPVDGLVLALDTLEVDRVFADYWVAYRLTWETDGRVVASPLDLVRDPGLDAEVAAEPVPAFVTAVRCKGHLQDALDAHGVRYWVTPVERVWEVVVPERRVLPEELAGSPLC